MKIEFLLADKIRKTKFQSFSSTVIKVGIVSIAIGISILIISFAVLFGFKNNIKNKLFGINGHLQVHKITLNQSFEETPFINNLKTSQIITNNSKISHINSIALKSAIIKSKNEISGVVLKGIDNKYNWKDLKGSIVAGRVPNIDETQISDEILISSKLAKTLNVGLNDNLLVYFIQNPPRARKVKVIGIYSTEIEDIDKHFIIGDIKLIRKMNNWSDDQIGHFEVFVNDFNDLETIEKELLAKLPQELKIDSIKVSMAQFFDWFNLLDRNIFIVIVLILIVASFNMISVLLIMLMERTSMIGLLKSLGASNKMIRKIFLINGFKIIIKGLILGNIVGLIFCYIQDKYKLIKLDSENYYMEFVPIEWAWTTFGLINLLIFVIVSLIVYLPTVIINNINPVTALKEKK